MKKKKFCLFLFIALCSLNLIAKSNKIVTYEKNNDSRNLLTLSINGNSSSPQNFDFCEGKPLNAATTIFCDPEQEMVLYTWKWYRNDVLIYTLNGYCRIASDLPSSFITNGSTYKVQLTVGRYNVGFSNSITLNTIGYNGQYDASKISYRTVFGDFNRDGKEDDLAAFYDYGGTTTKIHVWNSSGSSFQYKGDNGWWNSTTYNANKIDGKVVSGDFDNDGYKDDIAVFYDYGNNHTEIHIFSSNGTSFTFVGSKWVSGYGASGFDASKITGRVVSGDFDGDGYCDDIASLYDYGYARTVYFVWKSMGSSFSTCQNWFDSGTGNFDANKVTYRVVSGDFNRDGKDDLTALYDYGSSRTVFFVSKSTGSSFLAYQNWFDSGTGNFDASKITGRIVSGDFNNNGYKDDIASFYDMGSLRTVAFVSKSTGSSFLAYQNWFDSGTGNFDASKITGRIVSGDFNKNNVKNDISAFYYYGNYKVTNFVWKSTGINFNPIETWWKVCYMRNDSDSTIDNSNENTNFVDISENSLELDSKFHIFPNPAKDLLTIEISELTKECNIIIIDINGQELINKKISDLKTRININNLPSGFYIAKFENGNSVEVKKFIKSE